MSDVFEFDDPEDFDDGDTAALPDYSRAKWIILISLVAFSAIMTLPELMLPREMGNIVVLVSLLGIQALVCTWVHFDSLEFGERISAQERVKFLRFGMPMLLKYLFTSRGKYYGMRAVGKMLIVLLAMIGARLLVILAFSGRGIT